MILTAPNVLDRSKVTGHPYILFAAGGITGTEEWQTPYCEYIEANTKADSKHYVIVNPRRANYSESPEIARAQIAWEHNWLHRAYAKTFWFAPDQIQPITLLEFGRWISHKEQNKILIGVHPDYPRRLDVQEQVRLERGDEIEIVDTIEELQEQAVALIDLDTTGLY